MWQVGCRCDRFDVGVNDVGGNASWGGRCRSQKVGKTTNYAMNAESVNRVQENGKLREVYGMSTSLS